MVLPSQPSHAPSRRICPLLLPLVFGSAEVCPFPPAVSVAQAAVTLGRSEARGQSSALPRDVEKFELRSGDALTLLIILISGGGLRRSLGEVFGGRIDGPVSGFLFLKLKGVSFADLEVPAQNFDSAKLSVPLRVCHTVGFTEPPPLGEGVTTRKNLFNSRKKILSLRKVPGDFLRYHC